MDVLVLRDGSGGVVTDFYAGHTPAPHRLLVRVSPQGWRVSRNGIELATGPETGPQGLQLAWKAAGIATAETGWGPGVGFPPETGAES